jgi:Domain of unknown function (DUF397)
MWLDRRGLKDAKFRKAGGGGDGGVEVAITDEVIGLRDGKDRGNGPVLAFSEEEWAAFIDGAKQGWFDLPEKKRDNWPFGPSRRLASLSNVGARAYDAVHGRAGGNDAA